MAKERWRRTPDKAGEPIARKPIPASAGRRERWQNKSDLAKKPSDRKPIKVFAAIFALSIVLTLIVILLMLILQPALPHLTILTAEYRNSLLDPNAFALEDAQALAAMDDRFTVPRKEMFERSLDSDSMKKAIEDIATVRPRRAWLFAEPTTAIVYVNAMGFSLWQSEGGAVPYLVPNNFRIPTKREPTVEKLQELGNVVDSLIKVEADRKILVLDCQRMDSLWQIGVLDNGFLDAAKQVVEKKAASLDPSKRDNLFVFASCSPGEVAWVERSRGLSAFADAFLRGLQGEADQNSDELVTFGELVRYTQAEVANWSRSRADVQTPILLFPTGKDALAKADKIRLASIHPSWLSWFRSSSAAVGVKPPPDPDTDEVPKKIQKEWEEYFKLATVHANAPDAPMPWHIAPLAWRLLAENLRDAENLYRAGDLDQAAAKLSDAARARSNVRDQIDQLETNCAFSIPMVDFVDRHNSHRTLGTSDVPAAASNFRLLVDKLIRRPVFEESIPAINKATGVIPVEAYLALQLSDAGATEDANAAVALVKRRRDAELRIFDDPGLWAPETHWWIKNKMEQADRERRALEDDHFAKLKGRQRLVVGPTPPSPSELQADTLLREIESDARIIREAYKTREEVLAILPDVIRFAARRPIGAASRDKESDFRKNTDKSIKELLSALAELNALLLDPPKAHLPTGTDAKKDADELAPRLVKIGTATQTLAASQEQFRKEFETKADSLGKDNSNPTTEIVWREIHDVLLVPVLIRTADPERQAARSAEIRVNLLKRICKPVRQSETKTAGEKAAGQAAGNPDAVTLNQRLDRVKLLASLAKEFFDAAIGRANPLFAKRDMAAAQAADEAGAIVGDWWREAHWLAVENKVPSNAERAELFQADTALRLIDASVATVDPQCRDYQLRRYDLAHFFDWQANRHIEDFWARRNNARQHYFEWAGETLLNQAKTMYQAYSRFAGEAVSEAESSSASGDIATAAFPTTQKRLEKLREIANGKRDGKIAPTENPDLGHTGMEIKIVDPKKPDKVEFRLGDEVVARAAVDPAADIPSGYANLYGQVDEKNRSLARVEPDKVDAGKFRIHREGPPSSDTGVFTTHFWFRGHTRSDRADINLDNSVRGPTVVYNDDRGPAAYSIRRATDQAVKLLFVLDCSDSMLLRDPGDNRTRIEQLRNVLREFSAEFKDDRIEVGVRLFGHRYFQENMERAHKDSENILEISPLDPVRFNEIIDRKVQAKGFTPLYYALLDAADNDLKRFQGQAQIILISDGDDTSAKTSRYLVEAEKKDPKEFPAYTKADVLKKFKGLDIPIHAIGFQVNSADLKDLSDTTRGTYQLAKGAKELLQRIKEVARFRYTAEKTAGEIPPVPDPPKILTTIGDPHPLSSFGRYDVKVLTGDSSYTRATLAINVRRGDQHKLVLRGDKIAYDDDSLKTHVAVEPPEPTAKPGQVYLYVLKSGPAEDGKNNLEVEFALFKPDDVAWDVKTVHAYVIPKGPSAGDRRYACHILEPNVGGHYYATYNMRLEDWPDGVRQFELLVSWDDKALRSIPLNPNQGNRQSLGDGILAGNFQNLASDVPATTKFSIRFDFLNNKAIEASPKDIQEWFVRPSRTLRVRQAKQVYSVKRKLYEAEIIVDGAGVDIQELNLERFDPKAAANNTMRIVIEL